MILSSRTLPSLTKASGITVMLSAVAFAPAATLYTATLDASLVSPPPVTNLYAFGAFLGSGDHEGNSVGNATDAGSAQPFNVPLRVRGLVHVDGTTDLPSGESRHAAWTSNHLNLQNLSGPINPSFPNPVPYTTTLVLEWSFTITVSCTLAGELARATVSASVPGGPSLDPVELIQEGPGSKTQTISGSMPFNVTIAGNSTKAVFLNVQVDGSELPTQFPSPRRWRPLASERRHCCADGGKDSRRPNRVFGEDRASFPRAPLRNMEGLNESE